MKFMKNNSSPNMEITSRIASNTIWRKNVHDYCAQVCNARNYMKWWIVNERKFGNAIRMDRISNTVDQCNNSAPTSNDTQWRNTVVGITQALTKDSLIKSKPYIQIPLDFAVVSNKTSAPEIRCTIPKPERFRPQIPRWFADQTNERVTIIHNQKRSGRDAFFPDLAEGKRKALIGREMTTWEVTTQPRKSGAALPATRIRSRNQLNTSLKICVTYSSIARSIQPR